ncbi:MAG: ATP-binding cassette domain-containing protein [Synergistaceae bacterium]|jgi:peptide/nickel transport system ATP-binding protein|nr:ATP-binding cassette domain-containing protein [Synergistaceae bacterium]
MPPDDSKTRPLLETVGLKKYFKVGGGLLHAVDDVSLSVREGQTLGIVGESGCGKSTLGRAVLRLIDASGGEVLYRGENILKYDRKRMKDIRKEMQIIFQDPFSSLDPRMTVFDTISEPLVVNGSHGDRASLAERIPALMKTVGLAESYINTYPHEMDGGRRQRVGIARALALNPKFIVCDEPVSALDVSIQAQILNLLMDLQEKFGLSYMFITHDLSVVKHISTEIAVMYLGQCVERAPSEELFRNPLHPYTKALLAAIPVPKLAKKNRSVIKGEVSDPIDPTPGCRFSPRCDFSKEGCTGENIPLAGSGAHAVACRLYA